MIHLSINLSISSSPFLPTSPLSPFLSFFSRSYRLPNYQRSSRSPYKRTDRAANLKSRIQSRFENHSVFWWHWLLLFTQWNRCVLSTGVSSHAGEGSCIRKYVWGLSTLEQNHSFFCWVDFICVQRYKLIHTILSLFVPRAFFVISHVSDYLSSTLFSSHDNNQSLVRGVHVDWLNHCNTNYRTQVWNRSETKSIIFDWNSYPNARHFCIHTLVKIPWMMKFLQWMWCLSKCTTCSTSSDSIRTNWKNKWAVSFL